MSLTLADAMLLTHAISPMPMVVLSVIGALLCRVDLSSRDQSPPRGGKRSVSENGYIIRDHQPDRKHHF
jgi:hypothetical protein